jgi:hypothetical protein
MELGFQQQHDKGGLCQCIWMLNAGLPKFSPPHDLLNCQHPYALTQATFVMLLLKA